MDKFTEALHAANLAALTGNAAAASMQIDRAYAALAQEAAQQPPAAQQQPQQAAVKK